MSSHRSGAIGGLPPVLTPKTLGGQATSGTQRQSLDPAFPKVHKLSGLLFYWYSQTGRLCHFQKCLLVQRLTTAPPSHIIPSRQADPGIDYILQDPVRVLDGMRAAMTIDMHNVNRQHVNGIGHAPA